MRKRPFIITHTRSGLHLTAKVLGLDLLDCAWPTSNRSDETWESVLNQPPDRISFLHDSTDMMRSSDIEWLMKSVLPIHVVRDPKDVLLSNHVAFSLDGREERLEEGRLRNWILNARLEDGRSPIDSWREHVRGWRKHEERMLVVRYEDYILDYEWQARRLSDHLGGDVARSLPPLGSCLASRKGIVGDHLNHFPQELIELVDEECWEEIEWLRSLGRKKAC